jgi:predicted nucleic acid-binding protein
VKAIVDASVAIKWFIPEGDHDPALRLRQARYALVAPDLMKIEVANALWRMQRKNELDSDECHSIIGALESGAVRYVSDGELFESAFRIARDIDHPVYDCMYLALARVERGKVVTADARFLDKAGRGGLGRLIQPLSAI